MPRPPPRSCGRWLAPSDIREEERLTIARELHDQVGQALTALKLDLAGVRGQMSAAVAGESVARLATMDALLDETLERTRRISAMLRPSILDDLGLCAAIRWQTAEFTQRTGVPCETRVPEDEALAPSVALALFRILQEALTDVARHAEARHVLVELQRGREPQLWSSPTTAGASPPRRWRAGRRWA